MDLRERYADYDACFSRYPQGMTHFGVSMSEAQLASALAQIRSTPALAARVAVKGPFRPGEPGFGTVQQGFVEGSNVNPVEEITALISAQRAYEMNSRVVKTVDEMLAASSQLR